MLKCLHLFFDLKNIFKNSSNYLFCFLFIMSFITVFAFFCNSYQKIKNKVKELNEINNSEEQKEEIILETNNIKDIKSKKKHRKGTKSFNNINNVFDSKNKMMGIKLKKNNKKKIKIKKSQNILNRPKGLKIKNLQNKENNKKQKADNCIKNTNTIINIVKPKIKKKKKKKKWFNSKVKKK